MARPNVEPERRDQILRSTSKVMARKGIRALRVADVAKEAGLSSGIIHYYFDNKATLTRAAFERNFEHSLERRAAILESGEAAPQKLRAMIDAYLPEEEETIEAWHVWAELWVEGLHDAQLQLLNERAYGEWRRIVVAILAEGQKEGTIRDLDPTLLANLLVASLDGLALQVLVGSHDMTLEIMRQTGHAFVDMISTSA